MSRTEEDADKQIWAVVILLVWLFVSVVAARARNGTATGEMNAV